MKIIARGKGEGKTSELIKLADGTQNIIICRDEFSCQRILQQAKFMRCKIKEPIILENYDLNKLKSFTGTVLIDDLDLEQVLMKYFAPLRLQVSAVTLTIGEEE